jgi:hypothetical protein
MTREFTFGISTMSQETADMLLEHFLFFRTPSNGLEKPIPHSQSHLDHGIGVLNFKD